MSIHLTQFPLNTEVSGWTSTPRFSTTIVQPGNSNGHESRNANWQDALHRYNAAFAVRTKEDAETLKAFFYTVYGRETAFLLKDWQDFTFNQYIHGVPDNTPDGVKNEFQLFKVYQDILGNYVRRDITKPKVNATLVQRSDSMIPDGIVDGATGIVTFPDPPAEGVELLAIGEFYVPVRFDIDELPIEFLSYWTAGGDVIAHTAIADIPMVEVRGE